MGILLTGPAWFQGYDIAFNVIFAVVAILIAGLSYKAKAITDEKKYAYFGTAFILIAISYLLFVVFALISNTYLIYLLNAFDFVFFIHMLFMLLAFTMLLIVMLKIKDRKVIALFLVFILLFVLFSYQYFIKFHIIAFFLLGFLTLQFYRNYQAKKNINTKLVYVSFFLLTCSHIFFAVINASQALFVAGEVLQLLGFILLFLVLLRVVINNGRKKRKT